MRRVDPPGPGMEVCVKGRRQPRWSVLLNVEQFLRNMIDLYFQTRYLIEYSAVFGTAEYFSPGPPDSVVFSCTVGSMEGLAADLDQDARLTL